MRTFVLFGLALLLQRRILALPDAAPNIDTAPPGQAASVSLESGIPRASPPRARGA